MNFNYLLHERKGVPRCSHTKQECYWIPTGNIRSMAGKHVNVSLYCRHCDRREEAFLTSDEFNTQEKLITTQLEQEVNRASPR